MTEAHGTTGADLVAFFELARERGWLKPPTAMSYKAACSEVLRAVEGDQWPTVDIASLDIDDVLQRFETKRGHTYQPNSLTTYKSRFRSSVSRFLDYVSSPATYRPAPTLRAPRSGREADKVSAEHLPTQSLMTYRLPLRRDVVARLELPFDLRASEATRLAQFIEALVMQEMTGLP